ncbi:MAG: hypothetical protein R3Y40_07475 [Eubacteriales bacterium]
MALKPLFIGVGTYQKDKQLLANKTHTESPECLHSWAFLYAFLFIRMQEMTEMKRSGIEFTEGIKRDSMSVWNIRVIGCVDLHSC